MKQMSCIAFVALAFAYALGPLATQMLTPAVPFVHHDFAIPMASAQMLISASLVTIGAATLLYGPLADRFGRRSVMLAGTLLFCLASVAAALAPTPGLLIGARIAQAAGSAAGLALTRAIVHDVYGLERSGRVIAYLTAAMIVAPMVSPGIGGLLLDHLHWRALFAVCALFGVVALALLVTHLPETRREAQGDANRSPILRDFAALLGDSCYLKSALFFSAVMAIFYAGQAALPFLFVEVLDAGATRYGIWFAIACIAYVAGNYATGRWGDRYAREVLLRSCALACLASALVGLGAVTVFDWSPAVLFAPTVVMSFFGAIGVAPVQAQAVAAQPQRAGTASGLLSTVQTLSAALVVQFLGFQHDGTPYPMFAVFIVCATCALLAVGVRQPRRGPTRHRGVAHPTPAGRNSPHAMRG
jgi:DHA1 family bicyclomycin/chloramphenicol resistance-like MFS transporter